MMKLTNHDDDDDDGLLLEKFCEEIKLEINSGRPLWCAGNIANPINSTKNKQISKTIFFWVYIPKRIQMFTDEFHTQNRRKTKMVHSLILSDHKRKSTWVEI